MAHPLDDVPDEMRADLARLAQLGGVEGDRLDMIGRARDRAVQSAKSEFRVAGAVIDLMYKQCLIWCVMCTSPMISLLGSLSMLVVFWVFRAALMRFYRPSERAFAAGNSERTFFLVLLSTFCVAFFINLFCFFGFPSNPHCGPFNAPVSELPPGSPKVALFDIYLADMFRRNWYYNFIIRVLFSSYFLIFLLIVVILVIYFKDAKIAMQARLLANATQLASEERGEKEALIRQYDINIDSASKVPRSDFMRERSKQHEVGIDAYMSSAVLMEPARGRWSSVDDASDDD